MSGDKPACRRVAYGSQPTCSRYSLSLKISVTITGPCSQRILALCANLGNCLFLLNNKGQYKLCQPCQQKYRKKTAVLVNLNLFSLTSVQHQSLEGELNTIQCRLMLMGWGLLERPLTGPQRATLACLPPLSTLLPQIKPLQLIFSSCVRYKIISSLSFE